MKNGFGVITPKCKMCEKRTTVGNTNGLPNMIGFKLFDGRTINLCQKCLIKFGEMGNDERQKLYKEWGI